MDAPETLIERYLDGLLTETELVQFETALAQSSALAERVALQKDILSGIEMVGNLDLKEQLQGIHQETITPENIKTKKLPLTSRRRWLAIAAALIGIIGMVWYFSSLQSVTSSTLYATYAKHDFDFQEKSTTNVLLSNAEKLLKNKQYEKALPLLEEYLIQNPDNAQILLAKGIALTEIGADYGTALSIFRRLQKEFPVYRDEGFWYEGLLFLKKRNINFSKKAFIQISHDSRRNEVSKELISKL